MEFTNEQVRLNDIPSVRDIDYEGLDQNYLTVELIALAVVWFVLGIIAFIILVFNIPGWPSWVRMIIFIFFVFFMITTFLMTIWGFRRKQYAVRSKDIIYKQGLLWRSYSVLPFNRIQHAEVHQGPIERAFQLSKLKVFTAGGSGSDLTISGLPFERAQSIKHFILRQAGRDEEE